MTPKTIRRGNNIFIEYKTYDQTVDPAVLFDPDTVTITLHNPDGSNAVSNAAMVRVGVGDYIYQYQTNGGSPLGTWRGEVTVTRGGNTGVSDLDPLFTLVA